MMRIGLSCGVGAGVLALAAGWVPSLPETPATLSPAPAARYAAKYSTITKDGSDLVASISDLVGGAAGPAVQATGGNKPVYMTDFFGRPFLRFEGSAFLSIANSLGYVDHRNVAIFFVGRVHRHNEFECPIFSFGLSGASMNTGGASLRCSAAFSSTHHVPTATSGGIKGYSMATNREYMVPGAQLQVISTCSRTTANGGTQIGINRKFGAGAQNNVTAASANVGGEIGRYSNTPHSAGNWGLFDLYEIAIYATGQSITHAQAQTIATTLADHYEIQEVEHQVVLEGASTMQGLLASGGCPAMAAADYAIEQGLRNWRIVGRAISGNTLAELTARRDATDSIFNAGKLTGGRNVAIINVGRNDFGNNALYTGADHAAAMTAYLYTGSATGVLERGWEARVSDLPSTSATQQVPIEAFRVLLPLQPFRAGCHADTGETYDGMLGLTRVSLAEQPAGNTLFLTTADANDLTYYVGDQTHLTALGTALLMKGSAATPARGMMRSAIAAASFS